MRSLVAFERSAGPTSDRKLNIKATVGRKLPISTSSFPSCVRFHPLVSLLRTAVVAFASFGYHQRRRNHCRRDTGRLLLSAFRSARALREVSGAYIIYRSSPAGRIEPCPGCSVLLASGWVDEHSGTRPSHPYCKAQMAARGQISFLRAV